MLELNGYALRCVAELKERRARRRADLLALLAIVAACALVLI